jgi:tetratricopeptide (TPR) repeat protein
MEAICRADAPAAVAGRAVAWLEKALDLEPNHVHTLVAGALAKLQYLRDRAGAEGWLRAGLRACAPQQRRLRARCHCLLGHLHHDKAESRLAVEAFEHALKLEPDEPTALAAYGAAVACGGGRQKRAADRAAEAERAFGRAMQQPGAGSFVRMLYGVFKLKVCHDKRSATELLLVAARDKTRPPNCLALYYLGRIAMMDFRLKEMENWMVWALEVEPEAPLQRVEYAYMLQELGKDVKRERARAEELRRRRMLRGSAAERLELFERVQRYGSLRRQFLVKKKGLDLEGPLAWTTLMASAGWEERYADMFSQPDSWASLLCADVEWRQRAAAVGANDVH